MAEGTAVEAVLAADAEPSHAAIPFEFSSLARSEPPGPHWCISLPCALTLKLSRERRPADASRLERLVRAQALANQEPSQNRHTTLQA